MFAIAQTTAAPVAIRTAHGEATITVQFRWLPISERMEIMEAHDAALSALSAPPPDLAAGPAEGPQAAPMSGRDHALAMAVIHAGAVMRLAEGWDLAYADGRPVPWTATAIAEVLDFLPGLWLQILLAAGKATSVEALQGN